MPTGFLPLVLILLSLPAAAQTVRGSVTDAATGGPVAGALVRTPGQPEFTVTGRDGRFELRLALGAGDTLLVSRIGYDTLHLPIAGPADTLHITLSPDPVRLARLEVFQVAGSSVGRQVGGHGPGGYHRGVPWMLSTATVLEALEDQVGYRRLPCRLRVQTAVEPYCSAIRGTVQVIRVFVDGAGREGGLNGLADVPLSDVAYIETFDHHRVVWVVTRLHAERVARGAVAPAIPPP